MLLPPLNESVRLRYATFFYLYFMQGIPSGFAITAIANYLIHKGISSSGVGTFVSVVGIPWIIQFVWGPFIDRYQYSVIGHRKHWVVLTQLAALIASLALFLVHDPVSQLSLLSLVFFIHSLFASVQDASVDAMAISIVPVNERSRLNAFMRGGLLLGISFGAAALSSVLHYYNFHTAVFIQSAALLLFTIITFFIKLDREDPIWPRFGKKKEKVTEQNPHVKILFRYLWKGMTEKDSLRTFGIIALMYFCFSVFISSFSFHMINKLHYPDHKLSVLQGGWGSLVVFCVILAGGVMADRIGARKLQIKVMWVLALFLLLFNAISSLWKMEEVAVSGLLIWNIADPLFSVAAFPILMTLCKDHIAGSQFTTYMALINFCGILGSYITGWALHLFPAPVLGFSCGILVMLCIYVQYRHNRLIHGQIA